MLPLILAGAIASGAKSIELDTLQFEALSPAERVVAETLQGLTAKGSAKIWLENGGIQADILKDLVHEGAKVRPAKSVWDLVSKFKGKIKGAIIYQLGTPSLNVATGLCGPFQAIAIDGSMVDTESSKGLKILLDVRGMTEEQAFAKYAPQYKKGVVVEQSIEKPGHLRDFAVAHSAFTMDANDHAFRQQVVKTMGPHAIVFGWGRDESELVSDVSRGGGTVAPADWCTNLSVLETLPTGPLAPKKWHPVKLEKGVRYVAFTLSDGDNLQWLTGGFATDKKIWANPIRGSFPMTWEVSCLLSQYAPRVLQKLYAEATPNDDFIAGAGLPGYTFPALHPDRDAIAQQSIPFLQNSGLTTVSVLNANEGHLSDMAPWMALNQVSSVIYKDYAPYDRRKGEIQWFHGKPVFAYRTMLWEKLSDIDDVAKEINAMPTDPEHDIRSYALINVHAWSYGKANGPFEATKQVIEKLSPNTRVITANQLMDLVKKNLNPG